ncbi:hypothetical protein [Sphingomonas sp. SAFR-052]|uniref:hypothetical protein n=1 Tax=Sphingomonas sp. SAFR-052 TaxID=3436867 RepID=UPI003F815D66
MHLYQITATGNDPMAVFAESYPTAVEIFMTWWLINEGGELPDLEVKRRNPNWPSINQRHLEEAMAIGMSGIGQYKAGVGWTISPPALVGPS